MVSHKRLNKTINYREMVQNDENKENRYLLAPGSYQKKNPVKEKYM